MVYTCVDCLYYDGEEKCAKGWQVVAVAKGCGVGSAIPTADPSGEAVTASVCSEFKKDAASSTS